MIGVLEYSAGNLKSVENALTRLGIPFFISTDPQKLAEADKILFPGVGHATSCMASLRERKLDTFLQKTSQPIVAICVGMQLLFDFSEEGVTECLGILQGTVRQFDDRKVGIIPHTGWNTVSFLSDTTTEAEKDEDFYFVHSYYCDPKEKENIFATTNYNGHIFCSSVQKGNILGVQFHPEKSGKAGEALLKKILLENFAEISLSKK
ncbi:imidazole glycerol phosphate synthase subunit HisH [Candidatus Peregrinibacteria bacterium]|nr:MAG: imidazole glycerol phosphate synthase subunit HisH [Candidatus Peregrinibacteria bacterium]